MHEIAHLQVDQLLHLLNEKEVTSERLVAIFGLRAGTMGRHSSIITEDHFEYALKKARECDQHRSQSGKRNWTFGEEWNSDKHLEPLFGIPISIKDNIDMKGTRSTWGITARAERISEEDSSFIRCIKNAGLIPFVRTNLPQIAFTIECENYLWGRCCNPWNKDKTPGGSSGGEAAAIATCISPIGTGNDYGGSIRIPATFCGVCGLKPSIRRFSMAGNPQ